MSRQSEAPSPAPLIRPGSTLIGTLSYEAPSTGTKPEDRRGFAAFMIVSAAGLSTAIQIRDGLIEPRALILLTIAIVACVLAFLLPALPRFESRGDRPLIILLGIGLLMQFSQLIFADLPGSWHGMDMNWRFRFGLICAAILAGSLLILPQYIRIIFPLLLATFVMLGVWIIHHVPEPYMDVWMIQTQTVKAFFLHGTNPYAVIYHDPYSRPQLYAPGAIVNGMVHQGFPYPPVAFWMALAGYALFGDYRYGSLLAMAGAAWLIAYSRPTRIAKLAAVLFLFTPRVFFVLESGWTEPFSALLLGAVVFYACRAVNLQQAVTPEAVTPDPTQAETIKKAWVGLAVCLGLFVASKQYLIFAVPLAILLLGRRPSWHLAKRPVWIAITAAGVASLPLVLWNVSAFITSTSAVAGAAAFRTDALNYLAMAANTTRWTPSASFATNCGFAAAILGLVIAFYYSPRSTSGYCAAFALVYFLFFAFYKFAFCNYYYLIIAACCCAVGSTQAATLPADLAMETHDEQHPPTH